MKSQNKVKYDCYTSCNKCGGLNNLTEIDYINNDVCDAKTTCTVCGHKDYWSCGFFESCLEGLDASKKYSYK